MSWKLRLLMLLIVIISTLSLRYFLIQIGGESPLLDAMTVSIGIIATFYEIKRFADQYFLWLMTDIVGILMWVQQADTIMITKKSIYLIMSLIGLYNWYKFQRERNKENS